MQRNSYKTLLSLLALAALVGRVAAASATSSSYANPSMTPVITTGKSSLCGSTVDHANATGSVRFKPDFSSYQTTDEAGFEANFPDASWLLTVKQTAPNRTESVFWLHADPTYYWQDEHTKVLGCAFFARPGLHYNTIDLGRDDPGDCSAMLSDQCRAGLINQATLYAKRWIAFYFDRAYSSFQLAGLDGFCYSVAQGLSSPQPQQPLLFTEPYPKGCDFDFGYRPGYVGPDLNIVNLAGPHAVGVTDGPGVYDYAQIKVDYDCRISDSNGTRYYSTYGFDGGTYDGQTRLTTPILTVFFTANNIETGARQKNGVHGVSAQLTCPRVTKFTKGSRVSAQLPRGTPYPSHVHGLSEGDLAGIVVGSATLATVPTALVIWLLRRRRRRQRETTIGRERVRQPSEKGDDIIHELPRTESYEPKPMDRKVEIDSAQIVEAVCADEVAAELPAEPSISSSRPSLDRVYTSAS